MKKEEEKESGRKNKKKKKVKEGKYNQNGRGKWGEVAEGHFCLDQVILEAIKSGRLVLQY